MSKSARISLFFVLTAYVVISLWRIHVTPFLIHGDACWYDMVARNLAQGRGLVEDCVWYFSIPFTTVSHPIGNLFNPLVPIILSLFYKGFGISEFVGTMPVFLMDGILCLAIFVFCWYRFRSLTIAIFSSLIFTSHQFLLALRGGGGFPESYLMFFVALCCFALIRAWDGHRLYYLAAALLGALAYLSRNEGGHSFVVICALFAWKELWLPWKSKAPLPRSTYLIGLGIPILFFAVVMPWEIRNHHLFGDYANAAKYNFFITRDYQDIWSYSQTFSVSQFLAMGWKKLATIFLTSYYYKLETFFEITSWPLLMFLPMAWFSLRGQRWPIPVLIYFFYSYIAMGALNHVSQNSGWNGVFVFLPFWIPMAVSGLQYYLHSLMTNRRHATFCTIAFCSFIFLFHLGDSVRRVHRYQKSGGDANKMMVQAVQNWFQETKTPPPTTAMTHFSYVYTYFSGIPSVKIPTNDPLEKVWEVADKYQCSHLLLMGNNEAVFRNIYQGTQQDSRLRLLGTIPYRVTVGDGGDKILIFQILPKKEGASI